MFAGSHQELFMVDLIQRSLKLEGVNGCGNSGLRKKVVTVSVVSDFSFASRSKLHSAPNMN